MNPLWKFKRKPMTLSESVAARAEIERLRVSVDAQRQTLSTYAKTVEDQYAEITRLQRQVAVGDQLRATHIDERDAALAKIEAVKAVVRQVDETKTAWVMVSAIRAALEAKP